MSHTCIPKAATYLGKRELKGYSNPNLLFLAREVGQNVNCKAELIVTDGHGERVVRSKLFYSYDEAKIWLQGAAAALDAVKSGGIPVHELMID